MKEPLCEKKHIAYCILILLKLWSFSKINMQYAICFCPTWLRVRLPRTPIPSSLISGRLPICHWIHWRWPRSHQTAAFNDWAHLSVFTLVTVRFSWGAAPSCHWSAVQPPSSSTHRLPCDASITISITTRLLVPDSWPRSVTSVPRSRGVIAEAPRLQGGSRSPTRVLVQRRCRSGIFLAHRVVFGACGALLWCWENVTHFAGISLLTLFLTFWVFQSTEPRWWPHHWVFPKQFGQLEIALNIFHE